MEVIPADVRPRPPPPPERRRDLMAGSPLDGRPAFFSFGRVRFFRDNGRVRRHQYAMFRLDIDSAAARITLERPEARNAIPLAGWDRLTALIEEAGRSPARLLILTGAGGHFCAGADLGDFDVLRADEAARANFRLAMRRAFESLGHLPIPSLAIIEGACYGAGVALAMACDMRAADPAARFAITPAKYGISYPQEDVRRLVEMVGPGQAARLLFTGLPIDGTEAVRIGLADLYAEDGARSVIEALGGNSSESLRILKRGLRLASQGTKRDEEQDRMFDALFDSDELVARLASTRRK